MEVTYKTPPRSTGADRIEPSIRSCQRTRSGALAARIPSPPVRELSWSRVGQSFSALEVEVGSGAGISSLMSCKDQWGKISPDRSDMASSSEAEPVMINLFQISHAQP